MLTAREKDRYKRQLNIPQFGAEKQARLKQSRVAVPGVGGVGGTAALYLAAAGIGHMIVVDRDRVENSNLNRQVLFACCDVGHPKARAAQQRLKALNDAIKIESVDIDVSESNLSSIIGDCHYVLDCLDTNYMRLMVNRTCIKLNLPASHAFAQDFSGELFSVLPGESACLACIMDESFPEPEETPVMGVATGMVGLAMAAVLLFPLFFRIIQLKFLFALIAPDGLFMPGTFRIRTGKYILSAKGTCGYHIGVFRGFVKRSGIHFNTSCEVYYPFSDAANDEDNGIS